MGPTLHHWGFRSWVLISMVGFIRSWVLISMVGFIRSWVLNAGGGLWVPPYTTGVSGVGS